MKCDITQTHPVSVNTVSRMDHVPVHTHTHTHTHTLGRTNPVPFTALPLKDVKRTNPVVSTRAHC